MRNKIIRTLVFAAGLLASIAGVVFFSGKLKDEWKPPMTDTDSANLPFKLGQ